MTGVLIGHLVAVAPPGELVGVALRHLREPGGRGTEYRGLGPFVWCSATDLPVAIESYAQLIERPDVVEHWRWLWTPAPFGPGTPKLAALRRHLHGERIPGALMVRPVTCAQRPSNGGGRLDELTGVLGLPIDLDVRERRPDDRRRYCPTVREGQCFLEQFAPTVVLDAGGGLMAVWLFDRPAEPHSARRLGRDLVAVIDRAAAAAGWAFDSPAPHAAWVKMPGCLDLFRQHVTTEVATGTPWPFEDLRRAVPVTRRSASSASHVYLRRWAVS